MTIAGTHAANTLREIRSNVMGDSALFGERLRPEAVMTGSAAYSDLFMEAYDRGCGPADDRADSDPTDAGASSDPADAGAGSDPTDAGASRTIRLALEYIFEGYLLHYGESRLLGPDDETHFHLLAGDYMYARGLEAIATLEDLDSIEALSGLVRQCSYIHCEKLDPGLAAKAWAMTTLELAARFSSTDRGSTGEAGFSGGDATPITAMPPFGEMEKLDDRLEELIATPGLRGISSNIEAEFFHGN